MHGSIIFVEGQSSFITIRRWAILSLASALIVTCTNHANLLIGFYFAGSVRMDWQVTADNCKNWTLEHIPCSIYRVSMHSFIHTHTTPVVQSSSIGTIATCIYTWLGLVANYSNGKKKRESARTH